MLIYVTDQFEGFHRWPEAPDQVAFLRDTHRHLFKVRLELVVEGDDRALEFFMVKEKLSTTVAVLRLGTERQMHARMSCEQMAKTILHHMETEYPRRAMRCDVSEDGENGACVALTEEGNVL